MLFFFYVIIKVVIYMETIIILVIILLPLLSQAIITSTYNTYAKITSSKNMTGKEVARLILDNNGLNNVSINEISGTLSDHYSPKEKSVNLSNRIYEENSISSISVAAHEVGHAIQHKENYAFLSFRSALVPIVNFTSRFAGSWAKANMQRETIERMINLSFIFYSFV